MEPRMGIYVHIPFCASKCGYCDFYSRAGCEQDMPRYQQALITHIRECVPRIAPAYIDTVYFGGGTPSYYGARREDREGAPCAGSAHRRRAAGRSRGLHRNDLRLYLISIKTRFAGLLIEGAALRKEFLAASATCEKKNSFLRERYFSARNKFRAKNDFTLFAPASANSAEGQASGERMTAR